MKKNLITVCKIPSVSSSHLNTPNFWKLNYLHHNTIKKFTQNYQFKKKKEAKHTDLPYGSPASSMFYYRITLNKEKESFNL